MTFTKKLLGVVFLGLLGLPLHAVPTVFHCTESAGPGDVIGLQGDSFGATPQVWIELVTPGLSSLTPSQQLTTVSSYSNGTVSYVSAQIPTTETTGLYAIWVYDGSHYSASPSFINKARAFGAQDLCGTQIDASRSFRLFGRNMYIPGGTPSVSFVNGSTTLPATVTTTGSDGNTLYVTAPSGLVAGTVYTVNVQNGYGGTWGQGSLSYTLTARTSASDPFSLGVPWGADFASFATNVYNIKTDPRLSIHAVGDGVTNDTAAVQNAINTATSAGGGVVYFPAGTYEVSGPTGNDGDGVVMWSNVVLEGAGATQSTLQVVNETAYGFGFRGHSVSHVGFVNIGFDNSTTGCAYGFQLDAGSEIFAINTQFKAEVGKDCVFTSDSNVLVKNSTFITDDSTTGAAEQVWLIANTDQIFKDNTVSWYFSRIRTGIESVRSLIEANNLTRNAINNSIYVESGGFDISESDSTIVLNNIITKGGTGPLTQNNDGETIMSQNDVSPNSATGTATGSTSTTLIDTTKDWTYNYAYSDTGAGQLYYVAIVKGPGTGQIRQVIGNTTTSLTIATPWTILPTSSSNYTLTHVQLIHSLIKGNSLTENTQGIELYKAALDDVTITGNTLTDNGSIWLDDTWRTSLPAIFTVQMDTTVTGNTVSNTLNWYTETGSYAQIFTDASSGTGTGFGTFSYGTEFRSNTITAPIPNRGSGFQGEGYSATTWGGNDPTSASILGVVFDNNTAVNADNAYQLNTWDYNTTIWNYSDINDINFLLDVNAVSHASVDTTVGGVNSTIGDTSIPVANGTFVAPTIPTGSQWLVTTAIPDWTVSPSSPGSNETGVQTVASAVSNPGAAAGDPDYSFLNISATGPASLTYAGTGDNALPPIDAGYNYTLTVAVGNRTDTSNPTGACGGIVTVELLANGTVYATTTVNETQLAVNTFTNVSVTLPASTIAEDNLVGQTLGIKLITAKYGTDGFNQGAFDNITLTAEAPVVNGTFEDPVIPPGSEYTVTTSIPDWIVSPSTPGSNETGVETVASAVGIVGAAAGDPDYVFLNNSADGPASLTYDGTGDEALPNIESGESYTLTVAVGNRSDSSNSTGACGGTVTVELLANGTVYETTTVNETELPVNTFTNVSVTLPAATVSADNLVGQTLGIKLISAKYGTDTFDQGAFDNVTLTPSP